MCSKQVLKMYQSVAPLLANPGVGEGVEHKDAALVDLPVSLEALDVLQRFLEHGHAQHNCKGQECCDGPARQGACLDACQAVWGDSMARRPFASSMLHALWSRDRELSDGRLSAVWLLNGMPTIGSKTQHGDARTDIVGRGLT